MTANFLTPLATDFRFIRTLWSWSIKKNADRIPTDTTTPFPSDIGDGPGGSQRAETTTYRILRDTNLARKLKTLHSDRCQICGERIHLGKDRTYSEAHHIRPLGDPHSGPDVGGNIIVLCPNHHAMCDYGGIRLIKEEFRQLDGHRIQQEFIDYHNKNIYWSVLIT